jgi:(p)ppGpp synthase/HD superfamily hydrolase
MTNKQDLIKLAKQFTIDAHASVDHRRKYTNEPYHVHPERVAIIVSGVTSDKEVIAAAWLHDVLEDVAPKNANFDQKTILAVFGERVLQLVLAVTDISKPEDGNRAARKALEREHLSKASSEAKTVKLADLIDNIIDISKHDPGFARVFKREVSLDLPYLRGGNKKLYQQVICLLNLDAD